MTDPVPPDFWDSALRIITAAPIAFLATDRRGQPTVRPVTPTYEGVTAYIATEPTSGMARDIERNARVELLHWHRDFRHLSLRGPATLVREQAELDRLWSAFGYNLADFFGEGKAEYVLLRIDPHTIRMTSLQRVAAREPPLIWRRPAG